MNFMHALIEVKMLVNIHFKMFVCLFVCFDAPHICGQCCKKNPICEKQVIEFFTSFTNITTKILYFSNQVFKPKSIPE